MEEKKAQIEIPGSLAERIQKRLAQTEFKTVNEYVSYVLDEVLKQLEEKESGAEKTKKEESPFSKEDQESVEQRLRDLGYL